MFLCVRIKRKKNRKMPILKGLSAIIGKLNFTYDG